MTKTKTILIAEDDLSLNRLIAFKLEKENFRVISTADGKAALHTALESDIDAAVLDIMMPFLDGLQVLKRIRKVKPHLPVIILSVKSQEQDLDRGLELGANDYITKPFQPKVLVDQLKKILGD